MIKSRIKQFFKKLSNIYLIHAYGRHLKKRIDKNNFGRRPEY
tara:strand:- start:63 stop:188 length:126 start_codon:yes stop_codon:yes gene_type:complete